jgi:hypothetical protein
MRVEAAKALVDWKSRFADEVAAGARRLAVESSQPEHATLAHYRQAAQFAEAGAARWRPLRQDGLEARSCRRRAQDFEQLVDAGRLPKRRR